MEGRNECEICKEFHKMFCCQQIHKRKPTFFKILDDDFSSGLVLDKELLSDLNGDVLSNIIHLKGPTGEAHKLKIKKTTTSVLLRTGWQRFASFHKLQSGDVLLFYYEGNSSFNVLFYNKNGREKSSKRDRGEEERGKITHCKVEISSSLDSSSEDEIERNQKPDIGVSSSRHACTGRCAQKFISGRRPVTDREKQIALFRANKFRSSNACFTKIMLETSVYRTFYLVVPVEFGRKNLPGKNTTISLALPHNSRKWYVTCTYITYATNKRQSVWRFCGGWSKFVLKNNLEEGDVCVFEMKAELELTVHIFRVVEEIVKLQVVNS
ncbi:hypothetical protein LUZ62_055179 [Rhynchospora pubera]|uniref:TF-B3 domain-containing protein n=1 Tax=Rhynchospora pubera TaxID=906938 RepID=A0AAV8DWL9_9POAL|nr:hypothetical protein LUZ62_055179 [Rhynchospora pubera]